MNSDNGGIFHVGVSVFIEKDNKILITKRSPNKDHAPNEWEAGITGRVNQGETIEKAALREAKEELGIDVKLVVPINTFHFYRGKEKIEHQGVIYWAKYKNGEIVLDIKEQVEYKWVTPEESFKYITNPDVAKEVKGFIEFKRFYKE